LRRVGEWVNCVDVDGCTKRVGTKILIAITQDALKPNQLAEELTERLGMRTRQ
jgi:hypothetical protein